MALAAVLAELEVALAAVLAELEVVLEAEPEVVLGAPEVVQELVVRELVGLGLGLAPGRVARLERELPEGPQRVALPPPGLLPLALLPPPPLL